jgi:hypothetical protein
MGSRKKFGGTTTVDRELLAYHNAGQYVLARVLRLDLRLDAIVWASSLECP